MRCFVSNSFTYVCLSSRRLNSSTFEPYPIHITIDAEELEPAITISQ